MAQVNLDNTTPLTTLDGAITDSALTLDVAAGAGATMPTVPFVLGIGDEALLCTAVASDTLTVTREFDGTRAAAHADGDTVTHVHTAKFFGLLPDDTDGSYHAQGDIDLDGNSLIGGIDVLNDLDDVDTSGQSDGDLLSLDAGVLSQITGLTPTITVDSTNGGAASNLYDSDTATYWRTNLRWLSGSPWCMFDLGSARQIDEVQIYVGTGGDAAEQVEVLSSDDGATWVSRGTTTGLKGTAGWKTLAITGASARYWKLSASSSTDTAYRWSLYEVTFWESSDVWKPVSIDCGADWSPILDVKTTADDPPDDEFDSTTLDSKWTAAAGSSGTVSFLETGDVSKYDLASRPGTLLLQAGNDGTQKVDLYQTFTLADGKSIIAALSFGAVFDSSAADNDFWLGIALNSDTSSYDASSDCMKLQMEVQAKTQPAVFNYDGSTTYGQIDYMGPASRFYLRIARVGTTYYGFYSPDGSAWVGMGSKTLATAPTLLRLFFDNKGSAGDPVPIAAVDWIRLGTNDLDPWS